VRLGRIRYVWVRYVWVRLKALPSLIWGKCLFFFGVLSIVLGVSR